MNKNGEEKKHCRWAIIIELQRRKSKRIISYIAKIYVDKYFDDDDKSINMIYLNIYIYK